MKCLTMQCAAKVNLYLNVIGRRDDGYHDIETLFQPVSLWDEVTLRPFRGGVLISGDDPAIPWDERNICHQAATLLFDRARYEGGVRIDVHKSIPSGAGLGGGSSNAAATLVGLNELFSFRLSPDALRTTALRVGSDVPFFVLGRPAIGRGRGELLEEVPGLSDGYIVIVKPNVTISTKWAYRNLNLLLTMGKSGDTLKQLLKGLQDFPNSKLDTYNSFESGVIEEFSEIGTVLSDCKRQGAVLCSLSGSGSACFAVFRERDRAEEVTNTFIAKGLFARVTQPVNQALVFLRKE
jgi:4-diphosphocytidyl-2-C-methyl-D-erythritol kinase